MPEAARPVVWAPKAKRDLRNIWRYFADVASPEIADKLLRDIDLAGQRLGQRPFMGRPREEVLPGLRSVLVHPYTVFYRMTDTRVDIVRVLHERRHFSTVLAKDER